MALMNLPLASLERTLLTVPLALQCWPWCTVQIISSSHATSVVTPYGCECSE